ncbi:MAG TPA: hypothetical protein VHE83_19270 [Mycobacteriales bacterium]|nr:hypothetical protein [Mycobacteriales bacterium]
MAEAAEAPVGLERARHLDLEGRARHEWVRRLALLVLLAVVVIALVGAVGQQDHRTTADSPQASLTVSSPAHVRGGLVFTTEIDVVAHTSVSDMRLVLAPGWFAGMSLNGIAPQPGDESSRDGSVEYTYGPVNAGKTFRAWISWQTNPTTVGRRDQDVQLLDGDRALAAVHRTLTVLP